MERGDLSEGRMKIMVKKREKESEETGRQTSRQERKINVKLVLLLARKTTESLVCILTHNKTESVCYCE